jgi:ABC-2 type transport system ATP-binding protein
MSDVLRTTDLVKAYGSARVLNRLNLDVPEGSVYALVGPNGAGKTTTIKILMNILKPTAGRAEVLGTDSRKLAGRHFTDIGYVSENQEMPEWMTVKYLLAYLKPFYPAWDDARANELLRQLDLPGDRKIKHLSRGMRMKAALAASLAYRPKLIVLDEPFTGLDALVRDEFIEGLLDAAQGATIFISSHDLAEIESFASHVGYLDRGVMQFSEEMSSLTARFREVEVTLSADASLPADCPGTWLRPESSAAVVRFVETQFDPERTLADIRRLFPPQYFSAADAAQEYFRDARKGGPEGRLEGTNMFNQAIHIFKKDVRNLRYQIAAVILMVVVFTDSAIQVPRVFYRGWYVGIPIYLLPVIWGYLTARLIHNEPLPGDRQFWVTRPYRWDSLLAAKLLFTLAFINLPMLVADIVILSLSGFSVVDYGLRLFLNQVLLTLTIVVPVATVAAVTKGMVQWISTILVIVASGFAVTQFPHGFATPNRAGVDWIQSAAIALIMIPVGLIVLVWQYRDRSTRASRILAVFGVLLIAFLSVSFPWKSAYALQSRLSKEHLDADAVKFTSMAATGTVIVTTNEVSIRMPLRAEGIPAGMNIRDDEVSVVIESFARKRDKLEIYGALIPAGPSEYTLRFALDRGFFERRKNEPIVVSATFYLTLFGNLASTNVPFNESPVPVPRVGVCRAYTNIDQVQCRSPFGVPRVAISVNWANQHIPVIEPALSYAPSPADMTISPFELVRGVFNPLSAERRFAVVTTEEPLAHIRRDIVFRDVQLANFRDSHDWR